MMKFRSIFNKDKERKLALANLYILLFSSIALTCSVFSWDAMGIHAITGLFLAWFAPGYALIAATNPANSKYLERFILSIVASFIINILIGVVFDNSPFGFSLLAFVWSLWALTVFLLSVSWIRIIFFHSNDYYSSVGVEENEIVNQTAAESISFRLNNFAHFRFINLANVEKSIILLILLVASLAWATSNIILATETQPKTFTTLAIEGAQNTALETNVKIVIDNQERKEMRYRLEIHSKDKEIVFLENTILRQGEKRTFEINLTDLKEPVEAVLYREGNEQPYRKIDLIN